MAEERERIVQISSPAAGTCWALTNKGRLYRVAETTTSWEWEEVDPLPDFDYVKQIQEQQ